MLVLSRQTNWNVNAKYNEIVIGDNIRIYVLDVRGDRVRIGIECDRSIPIVRGEKLEDDEG